MVRMIMAAVAAVLCTLVIPAGNAPAVGPDKTITWGGGGKGKVLFDGRKHAEKGYVCKDCHPGLFTRKFGLFTEVGWMQHKVHHGAEATGFPDVSFTWSQTILNIGFVL